MFVRLNLPLSMLRAAAPVLIAAALSAKPAAAQYYWFPQQTKQDTTALAAARKTPMQLKGTAMDGRVVDLAKLRGKPVAIEFWALSDCDDCVSEQAAVKAVYDKYHSKGFEVIRIVMEADTANKTLIEKAAKENGITWPQLYDGKGRQNEFATKYLVSDLPKLFMLSKKGTLTANEVSPTDLESYVTAALAGN